MQTSLADRSEEMEADYGFPLPLNIPVYRPAACGAWHIDVRRGGLSSSYVATHAVEHAHHVLSREGVPWMATSLLEIESHAWHLHQARGVVAVAGLGMGLFAHAAAAKPEVERIIVAEIDPDVIALVTGSIDLSPKIHIVCCDAASDDFGASIRARVGSRQVDYLFADIWPVYPEPEAPAWTAALAERLNPRQAGWWGQEAEMAVRANTEGLSLEADALTAALAELGVPCEATEGYTMFCRDVAAAHEPELAQRPAPGF